MISGESAPTPAPTRIDSSSQINVKRMEVKAVAPIKEALKSETTMGGTKPEDTKKNETKAQSKEQYEKERGFVDAFAIKLIKDAKLKVITTHGSEAMGLKQEILDQRRATLLNKLSLGGKLDTQDQELLGMLEYQFPPKNIIAKEGFNPVFEPRMSLATLLDYYNRIDPKELAEKGVPTLDTATRKQVTEAATHLGLITVDGEEGGFSQTTANIVKDIFKDSKLSNEKLAEITVTAEKAIEGRLILTPKDFDPESGFLKDIGDGILTMQKRIMAEKIAGKDPADLQNEVGILLSQKDIFMEYITDAMKKISVDYQKLINPKSKPQLTQKETEEWFNIFGPKVAGVDQTVAIEKYFGKHDLMSTLKKNRIITLTKGGGVAMGIMSLLTAYGIYQQINKKEGMMG